MVPWLHTKISNATASAAAWALLYAWRENNSGTSAHLKTSSPFVCREAPFFFKLPKNLAAGGLKKRDILRLCASKYINSTRGASLNVPLVEFMSFVFICMLGESYRRRVRSLLLYLCYGFWALINSLVRWAQCCVQTEIRRERFLLSVVFRQKYVGKGFCSVLCSDRNTSGKVSAQCCVQTEICRKRFLLSIVFIQTEICRERFLLSVVFIQTEMWRERFQPESCLKSRVVSHHSVLSSGAHLCKVHL